MGKLKAVKYAAVRAQRKMGLGVADRSPFTNIYHCCVQRTGSQWFRTVFNDEVFYKHTGLFVTPYIENGLNEAHITEAFPERSVVVHLYVNRSTYDAMPKPAAHKAFFVTRDPRDIVTSFYFAAKHSHRPIGIVPTLRSEMTGLSEEEGIGVVIDALAELGLFEAQRSWLTEGNGEQVQLFRYEDMAADHRTFLRSVFDYLVVPIPAGEFESLCERKSFKAVTGRNQGTEDVNAHLRKGVAGDWEQHLTPALLTQLDRVTGGIVADLGY